MKLVTIIECEGHRETRDYTSDDHHEDEYTRKLAQTNCNHVI
jgi:hypothetical protein